ncbi:MAG: hypothetical protein AAGC55_31305 [Myxococcota bacterium]
MAELTVHTDLTRLRRQVAVPEVFATGAYVLLPRGHSSGFDLGPTDYQLFLWLPVDDGAWPGIDAVMGERRGPSVDEVAAAIGEPGAAATRTVPIAAARAVLPAELLENPDDSTIALTGNEQALAPFTNIFWREGWALRLSGGLLVSLLSS